MLNGKYTGLRAIEKDDLERLLSWRNKPEFRTYFREYRELSSTNQLMWYEDKIINDKSTIMFAIVDLATNELIGACGLCYIDWINRNADFSVYIGKSDVYIDEKLSDDAALTMIKYGFNELGLYRLWCEIYDFDIKKQRFLERIGFVLEGRHRSTHWTNGQWCDSLFYGLLANESLI